MPLLAAPLVASAAIGAGGSILGGILGSKASSKAAQVQADAADKASQLNYQASQDALNFNKQVYADQQLRQQPFYNTGLEANFNLQDFMRDPSNMWTRQFVAPTGLTESNDPGYLARLNMGTKAIEGSASARGGLGGGALKALTRYGQDFGSNEFQNVYNRAKDEYTTAYNQFQQQTADKFNRFAALAGFGQTAANQLDQAGNNAAGSNASIQLGTAQNIGQNQQNAAAARASGYVGSANAWGGALQNIGNNMSDLLLLQKYGPNALRKPTPNYDNGQG